MRHLRDLLYLYRFPSTTVWVGGGSWGDLGILVEIVAEAEEGVGYAGPLRSMDVGGSMERGGGMGGMMPWRSWEIYMPDMVAREPVVLSRKRASYRSGGAIWMVKKARMDRDMSRGTGSSSRSRVRV